MSKSPTFGKIVSETFKMELIFTNSLVLFVSNFTIMNYGHTLWFEKMPKAEIDRGLAYGKLQEYLLYFNMKGDSGKTDPNYSPLQVMKLQARPYKNPPLKRGLVKCEFVDSLFLLSVGDLNELHLINKAD